MENEEKKVKKLSLYILGGIAIALYFFITIYLLIGYFDVRADMSNENAQIGFALVYVIVVILMGSAFYLGITIIAVAGLIVAKVKRKRYGLARKWVIPFIVFTILPAVTEIFMILLYGGLQ